MTFRAAVPTSRCAPIITVAVFSFMTVAQSGGGGGEPLQTGSWREMNRDICAGADAVVAGSLS